MTKEYTKSNHHKDYARSLKAEQNRDAMPHPDEIQAKIEAMCCDECGHNGGADLQLVGQHHVHECPAKQQPPGEPLRLCDDCREEHDPYGEFLDRFRKRDAPYALYACETVEEAEEPDYPTVENRHGDQVPIPHADTRPRVPFECECGADLIEIL